MATTAAQMKQKAKKARKKTPLNGPGPTSADASSGEMSGANIALIRALRAKASLQTRSKKAQTFWVNAESHYSGGRAVFTRQLATMMKAGVPVGSGL